MTKGEVTKEDVKCRTIKLKRHNRKKALIL